MSVPEVPMIRGISAALPVFSAKQVSPMEERFERDRYDKVRSRFHDSLEFQQCLPGMRQVF